jgi:hypothetical protein
MKYVKTFEQLDYSTPFGKAQAIKDVKRTNINNANFKKEFFEKYPKGTKLIFEDKYSEYELILDDIKFIGDNYNLIFKAENGYKISIINPFSISDNDLEQISILPVRLTSESKELIDNMLSFK